MIFTDKLDKPGEHSFFFTGAEELKIEAILTVPETISRHSVAILGHPHSLQGGSMNNKVVTTMARTFRDLGIPSIRFNFRAVGKSEGEYDEGIGESKDMLCLYDLWFDEFPDSRCIFGGFSFGSYVAYRAAAQRKHDLLISVAPPVHHYNYREYSPQPSPWLIIQGDEDEVVPEELVSNFAREVTPEPIVLHFKQADHFFHGKIVQLKKRLTEFMQEQSGLL